MDIWLVAATAVTGYIARQLRNVTKGKDNVLESSSEYIHNVKSESPPRYLLSRLERVKKRSESKSGDESMISERDANQVDVASTSEENSRNYEDSHSDSLFGLTPEFPVIEHDTVADNTLFNTSFRQRTFIRRNRRCRPLTKPLSSLDRCLMSSFHREQMTMEDYITTPFPSLHASVSRPLLVTDGTRVINRSTADALQLSQHIILNESKATQSCGILGLESSVERQVGNVKTKSTKHGLGDATVLLQIGISIGIMSSFMASQAEVNKVRQELKQTENLVHDLEDELEMKESLIVKELDIEKTAENSESISNIDIEKTAENSESISKIDTEKTAENSESISNIEAELEAELERLEINMNSSNTEMEPNFEVEFTQGELRADQVKGKCLDETESNKDPSGNFTPESGNYAVSPRELTLRLHKLINSRLEKRIEELETALEESQRKVEQLVMESESKKNSWSRLWETREVMTYNSDLKIPVGIEHTKTNNVAEMQPLVMNLTGEALDAFNESYDDLMKINDDSENDDSPLEIQESRIHQEDFSPWSHQKDNSEVQDQEQELLDLIGMEDEDQESSDFESEMEKQLIKQIVEKAKQGSPVVLNAQKMLFLMEETEHNL